LAHISQRHFSRGVESRQNASVPTMAGLLGGLVLVATGAGDAGIATMMGTQAAVQQNQLRFSRQNEQEADRIGMQNLERSGMDPNATAGMFEVMQATSRRYGSNPPEFLLSHPLTENRIADARNRARTYPAKMYQDNPEFQLMKVRVELGFIEDKQLAVAHFRDRLAKKGRNAEADQYGLILALSRAGDYAEAEKLLRPLREFSPQNMTYGLAEAEVHVRGGEYKAAYTLLNRGMALVPGNHPITMATVAALVKMKDYPKAALILKKHAATRPSDPFVWYELAEIQGQAGDRLGLHQSRAEYFLLTGALGQARQQLSYARPLADNAITTARIDARLQHVTNVERALQQL
jgi:predicted Zn-dependent protease